MIELNSVVRVLAPFNESFPGEYRVEEIVEHEDGTKAYILNDIGAFDIIYLEEVI